MNGKNTASPYLKGNPLIETQFPENRAQALTRQGKRDTIQRNQAAENLKGRCPYSAMIRKKLDRAFETSRNPPPAHPSQKGRKGKRAHLILYANLGEIQEKNENRGKSYKRSIGKGPRATVLGVGFPEKK